MIRTMPLLMLCFGLSACAVDSRSDLAREVDALAKTGTSFTEARTALQRAGFQCGPEADEAITHCNRERSHRLLATCVQNVYLTRSKVNDTVQALEIPNPSCTGL